MIFCGVLVACDRPNENQPQVDPNASIGERLSLLDRTLPGNGYGKLADNVNQFKKGIPGFVPASIQISGSKEQRNHIVLIIEGVITNVENPDFLVKIQEEDFECRVDPINTHEKEKAILNGHATIDKLRVTIPRDLFGEFVAGKIRVEIHPLAKDKNGPVMIKASNEWIVLNTKNFNDGGVFLLRVKPGNISLIP